MKAERAMWFWLVPTSTQVALGTHEGGQVHFAFGRSSKVVREFFRGTKVRCRKRTWKFTVEPVAGAPQTELTIRENADKNVRKRECRLVGQAPSSRNPHPIWQQEVVAVPKYELPCQCAVFALDDEGRFHLRLLDAPGIRSSVSPADLRRRMLVSRGKSGAFISQGRFGLGDGPEDDPPLPPGPSEPEPDEEMLRAVEEYCDANSLNVPRGNRQIVGLYFEIQEVELQQGGDLVVSHRYPKRPSRITALRDLDIIADVDLMDGDAKDPTGCIEVKAVKKGSDLVFDLSANELRSRVRAAANSLQYDIAVYVYEDARTWDRVEVGPEIELDAQPRSYRCVPILD